jgi:hypothetical protein
VGFYPFLNQEIPMTSNTAASQLPLEGLGKTSEVSFPDQVKSPRAGSHSATSTGVRRFAGMTYLQLGLIALGLFAAIWGMWATSKIFALEDRRVVSVRLASIVNDFVTAEARSGTPPEQLENNTRAFMGALDSVLEQRAQEGQVILVGEAVIASSVPDVTDDVLADLSKLVKMPSPAAMPPAMVPSAPVQGRNMPMQPEAQISYDNAQSPYPVDGGSQ